MAAQSLLPAQPDARQASQQCGAIFDVCRGHTVPRTTQSWPPCATPMFPQISEHRTFQTHGPEINPTAEDRESHRKHFLKHKTLTK